MITRLSSDARKMVLTSAAQEARRRGDRRLGTDHLLLALLHDADSGVARALGVDLDTARAASDSLDKAASVSIPQDVIVAGKYEHVGFNAGIQLTGCTVVAILPKKPAGQK